MAGFMVFIGAATPAVAWQRLTLTVSSGVYGARLSAPVGSRWRESQEGTFADYASVREGDSIFFFSRRKIYGIAEATAVGGDCRYLNYPGASVPKAYKYGSVRRMMLWDDGPGSVDERWILTFKPAPAVFRNGVDIDDVLSSNSQAFRALPAMQNVTFARMDGEEEQALKNVILRANEDAIRSGQPRNSSFADESRTTHRQIRSRLTPAHGLDLKPILDACATGDYVGHEMALEAGLLFQLSSPDDATDAIFGRWDYVTHQVLASPFKPLAWADRMDVFGYSYLPGYRPTVSRYLVIEAKKDRATVEVVDQVMKYVDWVKAEHAGGRYAMIRAFVVAFDFPTEVLSRAKDGGRRIQTVGRRPAILESWDDLRLIRYGFDRTKGRLTFTDLPFKD